MSKLNALAEVKRVMQMEGEAILQCVDRFETLSFRDAIEKSLEHFQTALSHGGKIIITGIGKSGKIGQKIAATMCSTGTLAVYLHSTEGLHGDLGLVAKNDAVLALSYTGNTDELVRLIPSLKSLGVPIIAMGGNSQSKLAGLCDVWIDASVNAEACPHNLAPTTSTTLTLALGDAIAIALMQLRGFDAASFALNHPGGALGRRLTLKVSDLMQSGEAVATVAPNAPVDEVLMMSTQKKLGAVLVVEGRKLLGIVTDGDIRRALQHREKFFSMTAQDIMTANPVTITADQMAKAALDLMENRPSQIAVLPVVEPDSGPLANKVNSLSSSNAESDSQNTSAQNSAQSAEMTSASIVADAECSSDTPTLSPDSASNDKMGNSLTVTKNKNWVGVIRLHDLVRAL